MDQNHESSRSRGRPSKNSVRSRSTSPVKRQEQPYSLENIHLKYQDGSDEETESQQVGKNIRFFPLFYW